MRYFDLLFRPIRMSAAARAEPVESRQRDFPIGIRVIVNDRAENMTGVTGEVTGEGQSMLNNRLILIRADDKDYGPYPYLCFYPHELDYLQEGD